MRKNFILFLVLATTLTGFLSCSDDDDFDYPMETLYGKWNGTEVEIDGKWIDITGWVYQKLQFSIEFHSDGTYYGDGYFGTGSGTYKAKNNVITTYVDGDEYGIYHIKSLSENEVVATMSFGGESMNIKAKKK